MMVTAAVGLAVLVPCLGCSDSTPDPVSEAGPTEAGPTEAGPTEAGTPAGDATLPNPDRKLYYIRPKGGTPSQCTGLVNADYPGSGRARPAR